MPVMPKPPPLPPRQGTTHGPLHKVPCPHCGKPNDFRPLAGEEQGMSGWGDQGLETGATIECDHCRRLSKIAGVERITVVTLVRA
jgi:phage terminase large subunit GpA-like protein